MEHGCFTMCGSTDRTQTGYKAVRTRFKSHWQAKVGWWSKGQQGINRGHTSQHKLCGSLNGFTGKLSQFKPGSCWHLDDTNTYFAHKMRWKFYNLRSEWSFHHESEMNSCYNYHLKGGFLQQTSYHLREEKENCLLNEAEWRFKGLFLETAQNHRLDHHYLVKISS